MKIVWTRGVETPELRSEIKKDYAQAVNIRNRLIEILKGKIENSRSSVRRRDMYESPSWPLLQADAVGYERALFEVISLISDTESSKSEDSQV